MHVLGRLKERAGLGYQQFRRYKIRSTLFLCMTEDSCSLPCKPYIWYTALMIIIPYSGFCLRGPNVCEFCKLSQAHKFYTCSYSCTFISAHCTCHSSVLVISLSYVSVQILQKRDTSASLPGPKGQRILIVVRIMCTTTLQHFFNVANQLTLPNIHVDMVSSNHRISSNNDSSSSSNLRNFTHHCM